VEHIAPADRQLFPLQPATFSPATGNFFPSNRQFLPTGNMCRPDPTLQSPSDRQYLPTGKTCRPTSDPDSLRSAKPAFDAPRQPHFHRH